MRRIATMVAGIVLFGAAFADDGTPQGKPADPGAAAKGADARAGDSEKKSVLEFTMKDIDGKEVKLSDYKGKVLLFVNVASKCGLTPQYKDLQAAFEKYKEKGLVVLGFPANEFGGQEPGTEKEIKEFCTTKYQVTFPMFSKIVVKGDGIHPLYKFLTDEATNPGKSGEIKWNFTKFLVSREGKVMKRIEPKMKITEADVVKAVEAELER